MYVCMYVCMYACMYVHMYVQFMYIIWLINVWSLSAECGLMYMYMSAQVWPNVHVHVTHTRADTLYIHVLIGHITGNL